MPKDPEKDWIKKHIARLNIPTVPEIAPRDNTRVRRTGRAALAEAARLVGNGGRSVGPADPTATPAPETTVQSQYRPRYDEAITGAASFLPPVFGFEGGKETAHQVNAGNYGAAAATAALTLLAPEDAGAIGRKLTGKSLPKIARAAIKLEDGSIHWGRSHAAAIDAAIRDGALPRRGASAMLEKAQDGFVDAKGNFLTRQQTADRIRALGVKLPKDMRDGNFTSEELLGIPSIRRKAMVEPGALPHQGMRSFDESFPSVGDVQVRAKGARTGKPTPAAVADSALARVTNAAIRLPDGSIHEGRSHWPAIEAAVKSGKLPPPEHPNFEKMLQQSEDGFVDANGNFLTREETTHRMRALGHDIPAGFPAGSLTSEEVRGFNKPTPAAVADSVLSFAAPTLTDFNTLDDYRAALKRQQSNLAGAGLAPSRTTAPLSTTTTDGIADAQRILRTFQHNSGAPNMPRITAVDKEKAAHMAKIYDALPKNDPAAREAYDALNKEVEQQFQAIIDNGHKIEFVDSDPYKSSKEMMEDVRTNRRLKVFKTPADNFHPYMTPEQNDKFRAVHDWLAHAGEGHQFGPMGEENAYRVHSSTLSPLARRALATETRGQNSWVNFGPNAHLPVRERPFAEQKAALWPEEFLGDYPDMTIPEPFYSRLERAIQGGQNKATPAQWMSQLSKNVNADERLWTGVDAFLKGADPNKALTKDEVMGVFKKGEIKLTRKTLQKPELRIDFNPDRGVPYRVLGPNGEELGNYYSRSDAEGAMRATGVREFSAPKFEGHTEPGGTNYRENLTILQDPKLDANKAYEARMYELSDRLRSLEDGFGNPLPGREREARNVRRQIDAVQNGSANLAPEGFRSNHWSDTNVLMHTRDKTRALPDGSKVLHAEEIQSDWHQQGREKGYAAPPLTPEQQSRRDVLLERLRSGDMDVVGPEMQELDRLLEQQDASKYSSRVPDAPFKKTDDWQLLGLKQLIDDAVRGGYDRIAWTPGDLQAKRYSLSNVADRIDYYPSRNQLQVWNGDELVHMGNYDPKALPSVIGKDAAANLLGGTPHPSGMLSLEGDGLSVGGHGMRAFYDEMLPKNLNKYFKQLGIPAPEIEQMPLSMAPVQGYETLTNADGLTSKRPIMGDVPTIPSFPIPPALRLQVLTKGQPLLGIMGALGLGLGATRPDQQQ